MDWAGLGKSAGSYLAARSPIGGAVYKGLTGEAPPPQQNPGEMLANSIIGRYKRNHDPSQSQPAEPTAPIYNAEPPAPTDPGLPPPMPLATPPVLSDPGMGASASNPNAANESQWNHPTPMKNGGVATESMMAKVGEAGSEMAGGHLITKPTMVRLNKGEAVIPMNARPENKLQPDMIPGMSRYRSHMSGGMR